MLRPHTLFGCLLAFAIISACESSPSINNENSSVYSDTLDSRYKGKGIIWVTRLYTESRSGDTVYSQPDSNISNFVPVDSLNNDNIIWPGMFGSGNTHYTVCQAFTDTTSICGNIGDLEYNDSSLNLRGYKKVAIEFNVDSSIPNLTLALGKRRFPIIATSSNDSSYSAPDSNIITKTINATKGMNAILFDRATFPEGGTGYSLSFLAADSISGYLVKYISVNRLRVIITK